MHRIAASLGRASALLPAARARGGWRTVVGGAGCLGGFLPFAWTCREVLGPGPSGRSKINCSARVSPHEADISLRGGGKEVEGLRQRSSTSKDPRYHPLSTCWTFSIEGAGGSVLFHMDLWWEAFGILEGFSPPVSAIASLRMTRNTFRG